MPLSSSIDRAQFNSFLPWNIITFNGDRTLLISDAFAYLIAIDGVLQTVTVPLNSAVDFDVGTQISFKLGGVGSLDIVGAGGVILESSGALFSAAGTEAVFSIVQDATNIWSVFGDLA